MNEEGCIKESKKRRVSMVRQSQKDKGSLSISRNKEVIF